MTRSSTLETKIDYMLPKLVYCQDAATFSGITTSETKTSFLLRDI